MLPDGPNKNNILVRILIHPLENIYRQPKGESSASTTRNKDNLVELHRIGECPIRSIDGSLHCRTGISHGVLVKVAGEPVTGLDCELDRRTLVDRERVRLELANSRDPDKAVLPRFGPCRDLLHDNLGASVGERVKCGLVVDAVVQDSAGPDDAVDEPHAGGDQDDDERLLAKFGLMEADSNDGGDPRGDVRDIEDFIPNASEEHGGKDDTQEGETADDGGNLLPLGENAQ